MGRISAAPVLFENAGDLDKGGVLCAVPALLALGLLSHSQKQFSLPAGDYGTAPLPDTTKVINPAWRKLDQTVRRKSAKLSVNRLSPGR